MATKHTTTRKLTKTIRTRNSNKKSIVSCKSKACTKHIKKSRIKLDKSKLEIFQPDKCLLSAIVDIPTADTKFSFFYTDDDRLNAIDTLNLINEILRKYPEFTPKSNDLVLMKQTFLQILEDDMFVTALLRKYDITIRDLFRELYTTYYQIFKGPFLKKVQKIILDKSYTEISASTDFTTFKW